MSETGSKKLSMSEYAERFAANDIDLSILHELTERDLEKMASPL
jgi:hypothetical protein